MDQPFSVSIADAIEHVRGELAEATQNGADHSVRFELGPVKLALDVTATRSDKAGGGVRFWVVNVDAGVDRGRTQCHRVELELRPVIRGVHNPQIADEHTDGG